LKPWQKPSRRKNHFRHTLSKPIVERCVEAGVEKIAVGDLSDIHEGGIALPVNSDTSPRNTASPLIA